MQQSHGLLEIAKLLVSAAAVATIRGQFIYICNVRTARCENLQPARDTGQHAARLNSIYVHYVVDLSSEGWYAT